jgi:hypothetical protein
VVKLESASIGAHAEKEVIPEVSNELALYRAPVEFQAPFFFWWAFVSSRRERVFQFTQKE